jgi:hypothetical protein
MVKHKYGINRATMMRAAARAAVQHCSAVHCAFLHDAASCMHGQNTRMVVGLAP